MTFDNVITNTLDSETFEWVKNKYRIVDAKDIKGYKKYFDDDSVFKFGNHNEIIGKKSIHAFIKEYWEAIIGMNHNFINLYSFKNTIIIEANIEFVVEEDTVEKIPSLTIIERSSKGLVSLLKIFLDNKPLFLKE